MAKFSSMALIQAPLILVQEKEMFHSLKINIFSKLNLYEFGCVDLNLLVNL